MHTQKIKKLYYSISEVSEITLLKKYVLRYWETEFKELKPGKNRAGNRIYTIDEIKTIFLLKKLLYQEKYTIDGAKNKLKQLKSTDSQMKLSFDELRRVDTLVEIKKQLIELQEFIKNKNILDIQ
ncbi:MAG: MerR family transcriptional regulator [Deferribacteres bacterium]|nr:MerR family transcriptional regulator [candidate division KSB1 bacterium]MCB9501347.1 MerR family transcriptional regulator [Deferribacteres bacterium]